VKLRGLGLVTVIDLRTAQEAQDRGRYVTTLGDVVEHHLPMIDVLPDTDELPEWIDPRARRPAIGAPDAPARIRAAILS
jgi:hypothetical protein